MSAASIAAEVEGVGGQPVSAQTIRCTLHQIGLHGCRPRGKPLLKMMYGMITLDKNTTVSWYHGIAITGLKYVIFKCLGRKQKLFPH